MKQGPRRTASIMFMKRLVRQVRRSLEIHRRGKALTPTGSPSAPLTLLIMADPVSPDQTKDRHGYHTSSLCKLTAPWAGPIEEFSPQRTHNGDFHCARSNELRLSDANYTHAVFDVDLCAKRLRDALQLLQYSLRHCRRRRHGDPGSRERPSEVLS